MKIQNIVGTFIVLAVFVFAPSQGFAQIISIADKVLPTEYSSGPQDNIHVFCGEKGDKNASLTATAPNGESGSFEWLKYSAGIFSFFRSESGNSTSTISELEDGCYRVNITTTSGVKTTSTAWVFNNYIESTAEITESNCTSFLLKGTFDSPPVLKYIDLTTGQEKELDKEIVYKWLDGSPLMNWTIFDPPTKDTDYTFQVSDRFGCNSEAVVTYLSIVTKARFGIILEDQKKSHPSKIEAPLTITFSNLSENGDPGKFKWFIIKKINALRDSVIEVIINDTPPFYTFKETGIYKLKLVSKHDDCTDSISEFELGGKIQTEILIDASFIEAPNFFTPGNADNADANEEFVIRFFSMKSVKITIFNRWGKVLHVWESNNVQGFGPTLESVPQSVWDGKVGGRLATPGVYYYVVEGIGRDDRRQRTNGFFHLFRGK